MSAMNETPKSWPSNVGRGAFYGMIAWQVYAVIEYAATTLAPLVVYKPMVIAAWHWKLSLLLFGCYTLVGMFAGGFAGILLTSLTRVENTKAELKTIATLTLVLGFIANLLVDVPEPATLMFSIIVVATLIWSLSSTTRSERFAVVGSPWVVAFFLLLAAWVNNEGLARRSLPIETLLPILSTPDAEFHALQKEVPPAHREFMAAHPTLIDHSAELADFADTAALISQLDLVVTIDTAVAHLAGALGKPVWIMLQHNADWRWLLDRTDSPWYPTARLFRQKRAGDWKGVVSSVARALRPTVKQPRAQARK